MANHRKNTRRKAGTWRTDKGYSVLNRSKRKIMRRVRACESLPQIAADYGVSHTNLHRWLGTTGIRDEKVKCVLVECDETFPWRANKIACCKRHIKRYNGRGRKPGQLVQCDLPECDKLLLVINRTDEGRWCSRNHGEAHHARVKRGVYERWFDESYHCQGRHPNGRPCSERYCIDEHHTEFTNGTSHKTDPVIALCPTHHMALHRGLAVFTLSDGYKWRIRKMVEGLRRKHPELATSLGL